jgi:hypothetical protein
VAYVAKDPALGRACHVLECGGGLAEDVVTTVGQAFELRFKQYLQKQPKTVQLPDRYFSSILPVCFMSATLCVSRTLKSVCVLIKSMLLSC